ncbi:hypothetical protein [Fulvivirga kasyanovii]|uniref:hypothetical protein n=1 Tax=Fulvivirga kasyanovii TaxID=396812 RepID=UPI0031CE7900
MNSIKSTLAFQFACTFLWIGFVCAISFMEAWLKFRAPGITIELGLGIGQLVFTALNRVEWVLALAILAPILLSNNLKMRRNVFLLIPLLVLILQSLWLLPALDTQATAIINNQILPSSNLHFYFVLAEIIKVAGLLIFGINLFINYGSKTSATAGRKVSAIG